MIVRRFLAVFYPAAIYRKYAVVTKIAGEKFFANFKMLESEGYLKVMEYSFKKSIEENNTQEKKAENDKESEDNEKKNSDSETEEIETNDTGLLDELKKATPGTAVNVEGYELKEGETSPPKRYNSGSIILTMENAGQFIEDDELRSQIKGSGIGTSATRAEILKKLISNEYIALNKKTQILTPTLLGEAIYDAVDNSIKSLLNPSLTASWEKGLTQVASKEIEPDVYMTKLSDYVTKWTNAVKSMNNQSYIMSMVERDSKFYKKKK